MRTISNGVSVVIPTFNRQQVILRAIHSVLRQSLSPHEILVVDDASSDETVALVEGLKDPRIQVFRHEINRGPAAARNTGIRAATGKWIALLDSDDEWSTDKLHLQVNTLLSATPEVKGCVCGYRFDSDH